MNWQLARFFLLNNVYHPSIYGHSITTYVPVLTVLPCDRPLAYVHFLPSFAFLRSLGESGELDASSVVGSSCLFVGVRSCWSRF